MAKNKDNKPLLLLLGAAIVGFFITREDKEYAPGELVASGERKAGNGVLYEWRVVGSVPGQEYKLTGQTKQAGFGQWTVESTVAMGNTSGATQENIFAFLNAIV